RRPREPGDLLARGCRPLRRRRPPPLRRARVPRVPDVGALGRGFARVRCENCAFERLVPFSEPPSDEVVARLLATIYRRVQRLLARRGLDVDDPPDVDPLAEESPALAGISSASIQGWIVRGHGRTPWRRAPPPRHPATARPPPRKTPAPTRPLRLRRSPAPPPPRSRATRRRRIFPRSPETGSGRT